MANIWYNGDTTLIHSRSDVGSILRPGTKGSAFMQPHHTTPTKTCSKCGETKPATTEYFARQKRSQDGLRPDCKTCGRKRGRAYYAANRECIAKRQQARYNADLERSREQSRIRSREWRAANTERAAENARKYYVANRTRHAELMRAWYVANKEQANQRGRSYYATNRALIRQRMRARRAAYPEKVKADKQRRRALESNAEGMHTADDIKARYERQKGRCYWCNVKVGNNYHVDHVVPLSRGGTNWADNIVIACPTCNLSKHDKLPHEWPQGNRLL